jgi:nitrite reductase (NADH) small subunit
VSPDRTGFVRVAALDEVPEGGCLAADADGLPIVLVRLEGVVTALENRCPHAGAPLSEGFVEPGRITCSWHGWTFDAATGASLDDPSLSVPAFEVLVEDGHVYVKR